MVIPDLIKDGETGFIMGANTPECIARNVQQSELAYVLVTPVKDEEDNLPTLIQSIVNQNLQPIAWFIVDDDSKDGSPQIIRQVVSQHPWVHFVRLDTNIAYDIGEHYASVCVTGFDRALAYCEQNNLKCKYIALSDADMAYSEDYFAKCIDFLRNNRQFGIVSGKILVRKKGGTIYDENKIQLGDGHPYGTGRIWRKEAFADTEGYIVAKSPDTISSIKAILRGWKVKQLFDVVCYQTRDTGGKINLWNGYCNKGERAYYLNFNLLSILIAIADIMLISRQKNSLIKSLAFFCGYFQSFIRREDQIEDIEVKRYIGSYKRVIISCWLSLKELIARRNRIYQGK